MKEGKRQRQIAALIEQEMNAVFQKLGLNMIEGGLVSISKVQVTPDFLEARIFISFFQVPNLPEALKKIEAKQWEIKKELAQRLKHQLRRIPQIKYYPDDTLEHVFQLEELFMKLNQPEQQPPTDTHLP
jgi:ribosome-binding factor A